MQPSQIQNYLYTFFQENHCEIIARDEFSLHVQLTIEMDKKIMNRPFYWRYIESVNETPKPAKLFLTADSRQQAGEAVHFGSPRLHQLFAAIHEMGRFVKMYEQAADCINLTPWLAVNYKASFTSHQTKEILWPLGINLLTGAIYDDFHKTLVNRDLAPQLTANAFPVPYIIPPPKALGKLDAAVKQLIEKEDSSWADEALRRWKKDLAVLDYFHEGQEQAENYELEKQAMQERFEPRVVIEVLSGGLFYLR